MGGGANMAVEEKGRGGGGVIRQWKKRDGGTRQWKKRDGVGG